MSPKRSNPELNALRAQAVCDYEEAHVTMACVIAVENDEMSVSEGKRWMQLDEKERLMVDWGPADEHMKTAKKKLKNAFQEKFNV